MPTVLEAEEKLNKAGPAEKRECIADLSKEAAKLRAESEGCQDCRNAFH